MGKTGMGSKNIVSRRARSSSSVSVARTLEIFPLSYTILSAGRNMRTIAMYGAHLQCIKIGSGAYFVVELFLDHPELMCKTQLVGRWMISELAFLHQLSVFVVCHSHFDKHTRLVSVTSSRLVLASRRLRRIGAVPTEDLFWSENFDKWRAASAGQATIAFGYGVLKRRCWSCIRAAVKTDGVRVRWQHWQL